MEEIFAMQRARVVNWPATPVASVNGRTAGPTWLLSPRPVAAKTDRGEFCEATLRVLQDSSIDDHITVAFHRNAAGEELHIGKIRHESGVAAEIDVVSSHALIVRYQNLSIALNCNGK